MDIRYFVGWSRDVWEALMMDATDPHDRAWRLSVRVCHSGVWRLAAPVSDTIGFNIKNYIKFKKFKTSASTPCAH